MQTQQYISIIWIYIFIFFRTKYKQSRRKFKMKTYFFFIFVPEGWSCYTLLTCKCDRKMMMTCDLCLVVYMCLIFAGSTPAKVYGKLRAIQSSASRIWINWSVYIWSFLSLYMYVHVCCLNVCFWMDGCTFSSWSQIWNITKLWKVAVVQCYKIKKDSHTYTHTTHSNTFSDTKLLFIRGIRQS